MRIAANQKRPTSHKNGVCESILRRAREDGIGWWRSEAPPGRDESALSRLAEEDAALPSTLESEHRARGAE